MKCENPTCATSDVEHAVLFVCDRAIIDGMCLTCWKPTACARGEHGEGCETRVFEDIKPEVTSENADERFPPMRMRPDGSRF